MEGVRGESEINQVLESLDVSLSNAFAPAQAAELFTGLHAHYKVRLCVICAYTSALPAYMCVLYVFIRVCFLSLLLCISFCPVLLGLADCTRFLMLLDQCINVGLCRLRDGMARQKFGKMPLEIPGMASFWVLIGGKMRILWCMETMSTAPWQANLQILCPVDLPLTT